MISKLWVLLFGFTVCSEISVTVDSLIKRKFFHTNISFVSEIQSVYKDKNIMAISGKNTLLQISSFHFYGLRTLLFNTFLFLEVMGPVLGFCQVFLFLEVMGLVR